MQGLYGLGQKTTAMALDTSVEMVRIKGSYQGLD